MPAPHERLIVAMDGDWNLDELVAMAARFAPSVGMVKIGKKAFTRFGPEVLRRLNAAGVKVFLDLKFHDIPNTVAGACAEAVRHGVAMLNVHAAGGPEMMRRAREAVDAEVARGAARPLLIAVTVLTSLNDEALRQVGVTSPVSEQVERLARLAQAAGLDGVVASPKEISLIRAACGPDFAIVTPGIRRAEPGSVAHDDQQRVATAAGAYRAGASHLVIGRPIYEAPDPLAAAQAFAAEVAGA